MRSLRSGSKTMSEHIYRLTVQWGDCDPADIVFFPRYYAWFDQAAHDLFSRVGLSHGEMTRRFGVVGMPIVEARATFLRPSKYGDELEIVSSVREWRRKSLVLEHRILKAGVLAVEGQVARVWAIRHPQDANRLKAVDIPDEVRAALI